VMRVPCKKDPDPRIRPREMILVVSGVRPEIWSPAEISGGKRPKKS
jgi:hypothetical protein